MATLMYTQDELDAVGAKLESVEEQFSPKERALLVSLIRQGLAGDEDAEVQGFLLPAVRFRKAGGDAGINWGDRAIIAVNVQGDGSVMPTDQFSLNFTKMS